MLPNDNVSMSVGHLDHVLTVYSSMQHMLHSAVNSQDVTRCSMDIETLSLGNILQLCRERSFYINEIKLYYKIIHSKITLSWSLVDALGFRSRSVGPLRRLRASLWCLCSTIFSCSHKILQLKKVAESTKLYSVIPTRKITALIVTSLQYSTPCREGHFCGNPVGPTNPRESCGNGI